MTTKAKFYQDGFVELEGEFIEGYTDALSFGSKTGTSAERVSITGFSYKNLTAYTVELWFKTRNPNATFDTLIGHYLGNNIDAGIAIISGKLKVHEYSTNNVDTDVVTSTTVLEADKWYHVAFTKNGTSVKIYINGVLEGTATYTFGGSANYVFIGSSPDNTYNREFKGEMKDIRIWNVERTAQEITDNMRRKVDGQTGLIAYWKCNDSYSSTLTDSQGSYHGTFVNNPIRVNTEPLSINESVFFVNDALSFNGSNYAYIGLDQPELNTFPNGLTVEAWGKQTSLTSGADRWLLDKDITGFRLWGADKLAFQARDPVASSWKVLDGGSVTLNKWYHIAGVVDNVNLKMYLYINGEKKSELTLTAPLDFSATSTRAFKLASHSNSSGGWIGDIKEVRLWNAVRSESEIRGNMNANVKGQTGLVGLWRADYSNSNVIDDLAGKNTAVLYNNVKRIKVLENVPEFNTFAIKGELIEVRSDGVLNHSFDNLGNLHLVGSISDKSSNALSFNGTSNYALLKNINPTDQITVELWFKPTASVVGKVLGKHSSQSDCVGTIGYGADGKASFEITVGGTYYNLLSSSPLPLNEWTHLCGTYDGSNIRFFVNGVQSTYVAKTGAISTNSFSWTISRISSANNVSFVSGCVKDVRIWNVGKTAQEINDNKSKILSGNETGLVGYWRFDEKTGDVALDKTANNNHGTIVGATRIFE